MAGIYKIMTSLLGESSLHWQIYALITRWLCCLALWWTLKGMWQKKVLQITAVTLLFAIYPGFNQQFIAITYGNAFLFYTFFLLSLGLMIWAFQKPRWFWPLYLFSILMSGYSMFMVEYFFGLELLRPVFLWLLLEKRGYSARQRFKHSVSYWMPYFIFMLAFLGWRITTPTPRADIEIFDNLIAGPLTAVWNLLETLLIDIFKVSGMAWGQVFNFSKITQFETNVLVRYMLIIFFAGIFSFFFLLNLRTDKDLDITTDTIDDKKWARQAIFIGIFSLIAAGIPIWMTDLRIELFFPWDRFTLAMMPGTSLLFVGLITLLISNRHFSILLISILIGLAAGMHYQTALSYRAEWLQVRDFFWQMVWRAPAIEPGTMILAPELPFEYDWDNSLTAPLNWTYAPENDSRELPYLLYNLETRLSKGLPNLKEDSSILEEHRITSFIGTTSQAIMVTFQPPTCLRVIDPLADQHIPNKARYFREALSFSNPGLIIQETEVAAEPPLHLLGPEPDHDWCYYFEKAELARQKKDWDEITRLGDKGLKLQKKFYKTNVAELTPFIEGYAYTGHWDKALELSLEGFDSWENMRFTLCDLWYQINQIAELDSHGQAAYNEIIETIGCELP